MKTKKIIAAVSSLALVAGVFAGCGSSAPASNNDGGSTGSDTSSSGKIIKSKDEIDVESLKGTSITLYTHGGNRVLGEEKKDENGNTYRDESYAYLKHLAEKFEGEYGIHVDLQVNSTEDDIRPLLQTADPEIDIYTSPNFSVEEWQTYADPYCTLDEAKELYGDYASTMYNDGTYVYALMPAKTYNNAVVYNEVTIKSVGYDSIPTTQAEFEQLCEALRANGIDPISMHRVENWPLSTIQDFANYVAGRNDAYPSMLKSDTPFSDTDPMGKTIRMYTDWKSRGFFEADMYTDFGVAMDVVGNGKAGMMLFGAWVVPQIQGRCAEGYCTPEDIKFAPAPDFGNGQYVMAAAADSYAISKGCDNKDAARLFIEYISEDAQYLADSGYIANKKGVTPIVPDLYKIIDDAVAAGTCKVLYAYATDDNSMNNENVLSEAGLLADVKYAGNLYDTIEVGNADWSKYDAQVEVQNKAYVDARTDLGVAWAD